MARVVQRLLFFAPDDRSRREVKMKRRSEKSESRLI